MKNVLTKSKALISVSVSFPPSPSTSFKEINVLNKSTWPSDPSEPLVLCSSRIEVKKASKRRCSFFILPTTPCKSKLLSGVIKSPMLNTPANTISSTTIALNSSASISPPPPPWPTTRRPSMTRDIAFVAHAFSNWPMLTGLCPALAIVCTRLLTSSYEVSKNLNNSKQMLIFDTFICISDFLYKNLNN